MPGFRYEKGGYSDASYQCAYGHCRYDSDSFPTLGKESLIASGIRRCARTPLAFSADVHGSRKVDVAVKVPTLLILVFDLLVYHCARHLCKIGGFYKLHMVELHTPGNTTVQGAVYK